MEKQYPELLKSIKIMRETADKIIDATQTKIDIEYQNKTAGTELLDEITKILNQKYPELNLYAFREYIDEIEAINIRTNNENKNFKISIDLSSLNEGLIVAKSKISLYQFYYPLSDFSDSELIPIIEKVKEIVIEMIKEMPKYRLYFVAKDIKILSN